MKIDTKKTIERIAIGGTIYALADLCFQLGKGYMLKYQLHYNESGEETLKSIDIASKNKSFSPFKRARFKIIKSFAEL